jgi:endonuclease/exonuclease/phosphatase family metal-dependent hydrolase
MSFTLLSWNVENLSGESSDPKDVADHVQKKDPDVFGLFEVTGVDPLRLTDLLPEYDFGLTQGVQRQEILVGTRTGRFSQSIFSQKRKFKTSDPYLRPGALLTLEVEGVLYNILFLHLDSGTAPSDFGRRDEMWGEIWDLQSTLNEKAGSEYARFIVVGDLNTMGAEIESAEDPLLTEDGEIEALAQRAEERGMRLLPKEGEVTFNDGDGLRSNLDHVLATENVSFQKLGTRPSRQTQEDRDAPNEAQAQGEEAYFVGLGGWNDREGERRVRYIEEVSDHTSLYCEIETGA